MGRPSKLTEKQWSEIERRVLLHEPIRALAREFGISESAIRERDITTRCAEINDMANQIVEVEQRLASMPVSARVSAQELADELRAISSNLASAARYGSMTANRLSQIAHVQTGKINPAKSLDDNQEAMKGVVAYTRTANDAASIGLNLLAANKEVAQRSEPPPAIREIRLVPLLPK